jgi:hypothetical protein
MSSLRQSSHASTASCCSLSSIPAAALSPSRQEGRKKVIVSLGGKNYTNDDRSEDIELLDSRATGYSIIKVLTPDNYLFIYFN